MPRQKNWRKSMCKRRETRVRPRTDCVETAVRSPSVVAGSPSSVVAGSPSSVGARHTINDDAQSDKKANNQADKQANEQANKQPDKRSKVGKELSERENAFFTIDITRNNDQVHRNVTGQDHFSSDLFETFSANNVACYQAIRSSERLWNASDLVFGSFHQNDVRFSEHSRGYQCTCNALCMLSYAHCHDVDNSLILDKVLCEGDALYQTVIRKLKTDGKFVQQLLSLEEIPDDFEVEIGKFTLEKFPIVCGPLVDTQDLGLPTLHNTLQSAFLSVSSGLLTIGAICSAVFKKHGLYAFFDSHCHGANGLSATDGASSLITFASLDDLLTYMYAFYDSLKLDSSLQFDFLPINVKKSQNKQSCEDKMASHMEAYFIDQRLRQTTKTQSEGRPISIDLSSISTEKSKETLGAKRKKLQKNTKQRAREKPYVLECERIKKQQIRQEKRKLNDDLEIDIPRKKIKHDIDTLPRNTQKNFKTIEESIKQFHSDISIGPIYVCSCCHQTWFRKSVSMLKNTHISAESRRLYCTEFTSIGNEEWVCHTCLSALRDSKPPKLSVANGMKWPDKPPELNLHQLEERLIALRIPFMQIRELPRGGQYSLKGNVINVPVDIQPTINCLPRPMDENFTVAIQLKKKLSYKKVDFKENVRPVRVLTALHWLMNNSELYKKSGIVVDEGWFKEVTESMEDTVREFLEVSKEQSKFKDNTEGEVQERDKTSQNDTVEPNGYDSDHYSEVDANERVGNVDTLVDDADIDNKCDKVFTFAPGEGQHPLSLYQDKDAEYLCFPSIFCGQTPPSKDERLVPVHYSDIVKWELRSVDRRAAQSVPNIFFKHKKLQMKQIGDKVNLAVRRCKQKGKKITAAEARDSNFLEKLVNLDEGYYIFRQLRNSPAYLETRKKDIFAMIRQLSLPTWFISLSAADTRWRDLLKMLAKLNDDIEYSEKEIEQLTWQEKTKLVQKDPVTCSRYFDHRVQEFLNTVMKSSCQPI